MIKFLDIYKQDKKIIKLINKDLQRIIKKNNFILGEDVDKFERNFSNFCGSKYAIGCANGTDALTIALKSLNLKRNSEVLMPAMTYCSTAFAVINAGLKPVLVDTDYLSPTINLNELKKKINRKTKVIIPVHLYGSVADIFKIKKMIKNKKIYIIDDCAQAHGASINNKKVGSLADISCFSFYPGKNLGAYGDAGMITTNNKTIYNKIRNYRNLGSIAKFKHTQVGVNSRLDTMQAAILTRKITLLKSYNSKRRKIANYYDTKINNSKIKKIKYSNNAVYHQYVVLVKERNKICKILKKNNIQFGFHYPFSINKLDALKKRFNKHRFVNAETLANQCLSLPIDPNLNFKQLNKIVKVLNTF